MAKTKFVLDPTFEPAVRGFRGTVNPVGNVIGKRQSGIADQIRDTAKAIAEADAREAEAMREALRPRRRDRGTPAYLHAKALAWALRRHAEAIRAIMTHDGDEVIGRVVANYPSSAMIEFGGVDTHVTEGRSGPNLHYTGYATLRRALDVT